MTWGCATFVRNIGEINKHLKKRKNEITIRSSATEYLTYVAISGDAVEGFFAYCRGKGAEMEVLNDVCEFRMWWERINSDCHEFGYWLFDEG